jgi:hypothetical protein
MISESVEERIRIELQSLRMPGRLEFIEDQNNKLFRSPKKFKGAVLNTIQLYFDGLIKRDTEIGPDTWNEQQEALNALLYATRLTVSGFYRSRIDYKQVANTILLYKNQIITYGSENACKGRHLDGLEWKVESCVDSALDTLKDLGINLIIPIASGGFEPALLVADYFNVDVFPVRYSSFSKSDNEVKTPRLMPANISREMIAGKNVLIVDDIVSRCRTSVAVAQWIANLSPSSTSFLTVDRDPAKLSAYGYKRINRFGEGCLYVNGGQNG